MSDAAPGKRTGKHAVETPYYPIVYVRGYAMTASEREQVFHDAYYGFAATSVEKRQAPPPRYFEADIFEGLLIRLLKDHGYTDAVNRGLETCAGNPSRSLWVSRFYDVDYFKESIRSIEAHAEELYDLVCARIPARLNGCGVDTAGFKVILLAHSMGGLVCRSFMQKLLPARGEDPKKWVHRFVTLGTPHRGIDFGAIPDLLEDRVVTMLNPFDAGIFKEERMRDYLGLGETTDSGEYLYDVHSFGPEDRFPIKRCLSVIGSDWSSYGTVRKLTGGFSDGLVKQDRAYVVSGTRPNLGQGSPDQVFQYDDAHTSFWANLHRAHSGYRGIVNSFESYEAIQRFLFGDTVVRLDLEEIDVRTRREAGNRYFYDFEFLLSIRGTGSYLHRREQDPCENAIRIELPAGAAPQPLFWLPLHTAFMNSRLRRSSDPYSHFSLTFRVAEHRVQEGFLWDHEYPARMIYNEMMEVRIGDDLGVEYRWLSEAAGDDGWKSAEPTEGVFRFPLREAQSLRAVLVVRAGAWPDPALTGDDPSDLGPPIPLISS